MSVEPTSSLTFGDLILDTALKMGVAYYGADGTEMPQVPVDPHDLFECKRHVNNAIRMFINDAPIAGWRWTRPVALLQMWATIATDAARTVSGGVYDSVNNETLLTSTSAVFLETMEDADIVVTGATTFRMKRHTSPTTMYIEGDASAVAAATYSIASNGDFRMPRDFAGSYGGPITFARDTNQTTRIDWVDESEIRSLRNVSSETTGFPIIAALRLAREIETGDRRRYVFSVFPTPYTSFDVEFKYHLMFTELISVTEYPPSPAVHDETLRGAVRAVIERDVDRTTDGPDWQYYRGICLKRSHEYDARSGPRRLGYFGNNPRDEREKDGRTSQGWRRPNVTFNS